MAYSVYVLVVVAAIALYFTREYMQGGSCKSTRRLDGKTVLITGGNTGIGKETAIDLAKRGARVIIGCRNLERGNAAVEEIKESSGSQQVYQEHLDLASLTSVRKFAANIVKNEPRLNILINNAGVMWPPYQNTEDGFELQFGVNHLGHFLLTNLLLDLLKTSVPSRVVTVSSMGHMFISGINFEDLNSEKSYSRFIKSYPHSKLANILFTRELAKRLEGSGVTTYAVHPGAVKTELGRHIPLYSILSFVSYPVQWLLLKTTRQGAQTSICCALSEDLEGESGLYYSDCVVKEPSQAAKDDQAAKKLWDVSTKLVNLGQ